MTTIIKRDGREVPFNKQKIITAILKAFIAIDGKSSAYAEEKAERIATFIENESLKTQTPLTIEEIQKMVEKGLMSTKRKNVARAYIEYRHDRDLERRWKGQMMSQMANKLMASDVQNNNANVDEKSFGGRKGEVDAVILKQYALDNCMSKMARNNHLNNEIYIHDLESYPLGNHNCLSIPFDKLLAEGFNTRQTDIRPANSINTAFQLVAVIFQLQSLMQFGGVAATHLDWTMVPYVRKSFWKHFKDGVKYLYAQSEYNKISKEEVKNVSINDSRYKEFLIAKDYALDMTKKELQQAVEGMYHNLKY